MSENISRRDFLTLAAKNLAGLITLTQFAFEDTEAEARPEEREARDFFREYEHQIMATAVAVAQNKRLDRDAPGNISLDLSGVAFSRIAFNFHSQESNDDIIIEVALYYKDPSGTEQRLVRLGATVKPFAWLPPLTDAAANDADRMRGIRETWGERRAAAQEILKREYDRGVLETLGTRDGEESNVDFLARLGATMHHPSTAEIDRFNEIKSELGTFKESVPDGKYGIVTDVRTQRLYLVKKNGSDLEIEMCFLTSTSGAPSSDESGSHGTPVDLETLSVSDARTGKLEQIVETGGGSVDTLTAEGFTPAHMIMIAMAIQGWRGAFMHATDHMGELGQRGSGGCIRQAPVDIQYIRNTLLIGGQNTAPIYIHDPNPKEGFGRFTTADIFRRVWRRTQ